MSAGHIEDAHGGVAHHGDAHDAPHGTFQSYMTGFGLSVVLTTIPFLLVLTRPFGVGYIAAIVLFCAFVQILVHMVYFLHMTPKAEGGWQLLATAFTIILVVITLAGSLWIVFHLNENMMPVMQDMPEMGGSPAIE